MIRQRWDKEIIRSKLESTGTVLLIGCGLLIIVAAIFSFSRLAWIGGVGLLLGTGIMIIVSRLEVHALSSRANWTGSHQPTPVLHRATSEDPSEVARQIQREQLEGEWNRRREAIQSEVAEIEQRREAERARQSAPEACPATPLLLPGPSTAERHAAHQAGSGTQSVHTSQPQTAAKTSAPTPPAEQAEMSASALEARIRDNCLVMELMEDRDTIEYRRREREVKGDSELLAEIRQRQARTATPPAPAKNITLGVPPAGLVLSVGDVIMHDRFQYGVVVAVDKSGIVTIDFGHLGKKRFATPPPYDRHFRILHHEPPTRGSEATTSLVNSATPPRNIEATGPASPTQPERRFPRRQRLDGNWQDGWAIDLHTVSSLPLDDGYFDTTRTELGELLYQLKYRGDAGTLDRLADAIAAFIREQWRPKALAAILPIPPSDTARRFQPVPALTRRVGQKTGIAVAENYLEKVKVTPGLKNIDSLDERRRILDGAFRVRDKRFAGKHILLLDDLYRSGVTLCMATETLIRQGGLTTEGVHVLTVTKTRSKR